MEKSINTSGGWYVNHRGAVRLLMAVFMVMVACAVIIGVAHPALAATNPSPGPLIPDPTTPDSSVAGQGSVAGGILQRVFGVILTLLAVGCGVGAIIQLVLVMFAMFRRSTQKLKREGLFLLGFLALGGLAGGGAIALFNAAAATFGKIAGG